MESDAGTINHSGGAPDDRRLPVERRAHPTPVVSRYWLRGRRLGGRRTGERREIYVDCYRVTEWVLVLGILALSALDYVLTLIHLEAGGREVNPLMVYLVESGGLVFGVVKLGMTVVGLLVLLIHVRFRWARFFLNLALGVYALLLIYHLYLRFVA